MSSLQDLYREVILDHYRSPRNRGELPSPPAVVSEGKNPVCGDELTLYIEFDDSTIKDVKMSGSGCSISQASSSMMTAAIKGKTIDDAKDLITNFKSLMDIHETKLEESSSNESAKSDEEFSSSLGELAAMTGVVKFPVRIKCATLSFNTLSNAIDAHETGTETKTASTE